MKKVLGFFKTNFIFTVAIVAAIISCFFVPIDKEYLGYFDIDTIACITLLLLVIAGFSDIQFFQKVARWLVKKFKTTRSIIMCLIFITYVSALVNANDMSLLTFLPLAFIVLKLLLTTMKSTQFVIDNLSKQMEVIFPILITLITSIGGKVTASTFQPILATLSTIITKIFTAILIPFHKIRVYKNLLNGFCVLRHWKPLRNK